MHTCALILILVALLTGPRPAAASEVELIGHFSNIIVSEGEDPHQVDGFAVHLYRNGTTVFGMLAAANGSLEPSSGRLYDIDFNPVTKKLRFKAKYSMGWESNKATAPEGRASRDQLNFSGTVMKNRLVGTIMLKDGYSPEKQGMVQNISMKRMAYLTLLMVLLY